MPEQNCEHCGFRALHDRKPQSILGRLWRWHIGWCPGWKSYMGTVSEEKKELLIRQYNLPRDKYKQA
jgi:hypothetical protein